MPETPEPTDETEPSGPAAADALPAPGDTLDRYRVVARLGAGGMGVVFRAIDVDLEREVALKVLRPASGGTDARRRLLDEARVMAKLRHPHVVAVHDVGTARGLDFLAIELIAGQDLGAWLKQAPRPPRAILDAFVAAGRGLAAAHAAGVVHRDFKPTNVLVGDDGRVAVGDFGVAIAEAGGEGERAGTPAYMSPEQLAGEAVDARSDQFSFCVALFEALAGARPFPKNAPGEVLAGPPPLRANVPARVKRAIARGLAAAREDRHPSMDALLAALDDGRARRRRRAFATALLLVAIAALANWWMVGRASDRAGAVDPCHSDPYAEVDAARDAVERALSTSAARTTVLAGLDDYATHWRARWIEVCAAPHAHAAQACLLDARDQADALAGELARAGAPLVDGVVAVQALPDPSRCAAEGAPQLPDDPALGDQVRDLRAELARLRGQLPSFNADVSGATRALERARQIGYPPAIAEAELVLGEAEAARPDVAAARAQLSDASVDAEAAGDDDTRVAALVAIAILEIRYSSDHDAVTRAARAAAVAAQRPGIDPRRLAELANARAELAARDQDGPAAIALFEQAAAIDDGLGAHVDAARARGRAAQLLGENGDPARGVELLDATIATLTDALGPDDDAVRGARFDRARARFLAGDYVGAHAEIAQLGPPAPPPAGPAVLSGHVVDASGAPVAGATLAIEATELHGDGGYLMQPVLPTDLAGMDDRLLTTDRDGGFTAHVASRSYLVLAEDEVHGRSFPVEVTAPRDLTVTLSPWARLHGNVTGKQPPGLHLHVVPAGGIEYHLEVRIAGASYQARVPAGTHQVQLYRSEVIQREIYQVQSVTLAPGEDRQVDFALPATVHVIVHLRDHVGSPANGVVVLIGGSLRPAPRNAKDLIALVGDTDQHMMFGDATELRGDDRVADLPAVVPGAYTMCFGAMTGDLLDPSTMHKLEAHAADYPVTCTAITIAAAPAQQDVTAALK